MEKVLIKLLGAISFEGIEYPAGSQLKVDEKTAKELIDNGTAEDYSQKAAEEAVEKRIQDGIKKEMDAIKKKAADDAEKKLAGGQIEVKAPGLDPCAGYIGAKEKKDYTKQEINHAYGMFIKDVLREGTSGEKASDKLPKWVEDCKAAGDGSVGLRPCNRVLVEL